jgi:hypothetical protein
VYRVLYGFALTVRFLLELAAMGAMGYAAFGIGGPLGVLAAAAAVGVTGLLWGLFVAPRAPRVLPDRQRLALEIAIFAVAVMALLAKGEFILGLVLAGSYILDRLALWAIGAPLFQTVPNPER